MLRFDLYRLVPLGVVEEKAVPLGAEEEVVPLGIAEAVLLGKQMYWVLISEGRGFLSVKGKECLGIPFPIKYEGTL